MQPLGSRAAVVAAVVVVVAAVVVVVALRDFFQYEEGV